MLRIQRASPSIDFEIGPLTHIIESIPLNPVEYLHICSLNGSLSAEEHKAHTPLKAAGILKLPAISLPIPMGDILHAMAAPSPPELPPADLLGCHGFKVLPQRKLNESKLKAS